MRVELIQHVELIQLHHQVYRIMICFEFLPPQQVLQKGVSKSHTIQVP